MSETTRANPLENAIRPHSSRTLLEGIIRFIFLSSASDIFIWDCPIAYLFLRDVLLLLLLPLPFVLEKIRLNLGNYLRANGPKDDICMKKRKCITCRHEFSNGRLMLIDQIKHIDPFPS